jgi:hypothetical protein
MKTKEEIRVETDSYGTKRYFNKRGRRHRLDGPAVEYLDGSESWYQNGQLHRLDGPAVEYTGGSKYWYQNGLLHRLDGPAIERFNGTKHWWQYGELHRLDGPAIECSDGTREWYFKGQGPLHPLEWLKLIIEDKKYDCRYNSAFCKKNYFVIRSETVVL